MNSICIVIENEAYNSSSEVSADLALALSRELAVPLVDEIAAAQFKYHLRITARGLELLALYKEGKTRLFVDFVKGAMGYRRIHGGGYRQAIAKAVGLKNATQSLSVLDATAGLGKDAFILASLGARLHLVERSPIIAALLKDGLKRALQEPEINRFLKEKIQLSVGDACEIMANIQNEKPDGKTGEKPDVVYLDPMFPEKNKSALTTIDLRIIRDIVGPDMDAEKLFETAVKTAKHRVVVKRPIQAPTISAVKPSFSLAGKRNRYDVYILFSNIFSGISAN